jgi:hypothetical protein
MVVLLQISISIVAGLPLQEWLTQEPSKGSLMMIAWSMEGKL